MKFRQPIVRDTFIYTVTDAICKGMSFLLLPLVSFYLVPDELGIAANFDVLQFIVSLISGQAVVNALPYFYYERSKDQFAILVSNLFFIIVLINIVISIIIFFASGLFEHYLHLGFMLQLLTVVFTIVQLLHSVNTVLYRLEDNAKAFSAIQIAESIIQVLLVLFLVVQLKMGAVGKICSATGGYLFFAIINLYLLNKRHYIRFVIDKSAISELLKFGIPLLPHSLSFWIKSGADKILITTYCGLTANGLYSMALSFGAIYTMLNNAFMMAFVPYLQKRINSMTPENEYSEKKKYVKILYTIGLLFFLLFGVIVVGCWVLMKLVLSSSYDGAFQFIPWIILSLAIYAFYSLVIQFPYTVKKTAGIGIITLSGSIVQILITFYLIKVIGIDGVKYSLVIGALIIMSGIWWYSNKVYPLPWFSFFNRKK